MMKALNIVYIDTQERLKKVENKISLCRRLVLDVEFMRRDTYYPILALIQITFDRENAQYLIDPLACDVSNLLNLLCSSHCLKVIHACREDIQALFQQKENFSITNIFDTQIAAQYLNIGKQIGYKYLVEHFCDIILPKEQVCSDWLARPLSKEQLDYAAADVAYLSDISVQLIDSLISQGLYQYVLDDSQFVVWMSHYAIDPDDYYLTLKQAYGFNKYQLNKLQRLCNWREVNIRRDNVPRSRFLSDAKIVEFVEMNVSDKVVVNSIVRRVNSLNDSQVVSLKQAFSDAKKNSSDSIIPPLKPCGRSDKDQIKVLYQHVESIASYIEVAPELICSKRMLKSWLVLYKNRLHENDLHKDEIHQKSKDINYDDKDPADVEGLGLYFNRWRSFLDLIFRFVIN